jgi:metal-responsive CopG/Arc/MetJ family transcriptional regulator
MKTAISLPDEVFHQADQLARRNGVSRSQLVSDALREYVARHAPDEITDAMNRVVDAIGSAENQFAAAGARRLLKQTEW